MKVLFQSGTFISSENLNLLSLAANDVGVIKGCDVYEDKANNSLRVLEGFVLFTDGTLVYLTKEDSIQLSNLPKNNYYVYVVRYGNNFVLEASSILPTFEYILLAYVVISDKVEIFNIKNNKEKCEKIIEGYSLKDNIITNNISNINNIKDSFNNLIYFNANVRENGFIIIPFTFPNFSINKVKLLASFGEINVGIKINKGFDTKYETNDSSISYDSTHSVYEFNVANISEIKNGDLCSLTISLTPDDTFEHNIKIFSIMMQT